MDLEWNNTYGRKINGFINEIIEIGAVKLDEKFNVIDTFSSLVRVQIGKKLRGSVKRLTNITNEDLNSGTQFTQIFAEFGCWVGSGDTIMLTWGDGDIRVLIDNYRYINGIETIMFLSSYADLQKLFQNVYKTSPSKQIGLSNAAQLAEIDCEKYATHRGLDDSLISAEIFVKCFNAEELAKITSICDKTFYERLAFKAFAIKNIDSPLVDKSELNYSCARCHHQAKQMTQWKNVNQYFRAEFYCEKCDIRYKVGIRFKKHYDRLDIRKTSSVIEDIAEENEHEDTVEAGKKMCSN
jgi:inhibitor of KinA sporulation pathway (predicted exonuclease)